MEVNVVLIDDNRDNLRHMVEVLSRSVTKVSYGHDVITPKFHRFLPMYSRDDPTRIDLDATLKAVEAVKPGVAIVDLKLEGDEADDYSGVAVSLKIKSACNDCCIILVSSYLAEVPKRLDNLELFRFRVDRNQFDFWAELPKRFSEAVIYHATALDFRRLLKAPHAPGRAVYISYAWDDVGDTRPSREEIVNRMERSLLKNGYDVRREKTKLGYTGLISAYMAEVGRGGCVIAVLSDKYLRSLFCMYELLEVYRNQDFHKRVCPVVLPDAHVKELAHRDFYSEYWMSEFKQYQEQIKQYQEQIKSPEPAILSRQDLERIDRYRDISQEVGKLLSFIANMNHLTPEMLEENDFAILRRHIDACLEGSDGFVIPTATPIKSPHPIRLFYSYSHKDDALRDKLEEALTMLKRQGLIAGWHDRRISAGEEWKGAIDKNLDEAQVILLLISASFLASDYCYDVEMKRALDRHERREARVIPIILRPVDWRGALFGSLQALPKDGKPIVKWRPPDDGFKNVAEGIRRVIEDLTEHPR